MTDNLPIFKYFPDPISSGAVGVSTETCQCCNQKRGYICPVGIYSAQDVEFICPWCVHDGSAAKKFNGDFHTEDCMNDNNLKPEILNEVCERTPRFPTWNFESWIAHCNDACEFHGDATKEDIDNISQKSLDVSLDYNGFDKDDWLYLTKEYEPGSSPSIYKFKCRDCSLFIYWIDY